MINIYVDFGGVRHRTGIGSSGLSTSILSIGVSMFGIGRIDNGASNTAVKKSPN